TTGGVLAILDLFSGPDTVAGSDVLVRGEFSESKVDIYERLVYGTFIYPNPASREVNILSNDPLHTIRFMDMLGRESLTGTLSREGTLKFDVSTLPSGLYKVLLDHSGKRLPITNLVVLRE